MISRNKNTLSTGVWLLKALCVIKLFINLTNKLIREKDCHVLAIQHEFSFKAKFTFTSSERTFHPPVWSDLSPATLLPQPCHYIIIWNGMFYLSDYLFFVGLSNQNEKCLGLIHCWILRAQSGIWQVLNKQVFDEGLDFSPKQFLKICLEFEFYRKRELSNLSDLVVSRFRKNFFYFGVCGYHSLAHFWSLCLLFLALLYWFSQYNIEYNHNNGHLLLISDLEGKAFNISQ